MNNASYVGDSTMIEAITGRQIFTDWAQADVYYNRIDFTLI